MSAHVELHSMLDLPLRAAYLDPYLAHRCADSLAVLVTVAIAVRRGL